MSTVVREKKRTLEAAHGRWLEILPALGVPAKYLNGKNQPCPSCGGDDRFRFTDRNGDGDYFCNGCGAGKGVTLVGKVNGWNYAESAKRVDEVIGNLPAEVRHIEPKKTDSKIALRELWKRSQAIEPGDAAWLYLYSRGLKVSSKVLRYVSAMYHSGDKSEHPGMIATICDHQGNPKTLHRTYLTREGKKANLEPFRMLMPGDFPKGGAVRLGSVADTLGIAEGIETALSAEVLFGFPVWSAIAEGFLQSWEPPPEVKRVVICGDNDVNYVGQNAAYALARRLINEHRSLTVDVRIPDRVGDWNDVLLQGGANVRAA